MDFSFLLFLVVGVQFLQAISSLPYLFTFTISFIISAFFSYCCIASNTLPNLDFEIFYPTKRKTVEKLPTSHNIYDDKITQKLREITSNLIRDFILDWYNTISHDVEFVQEAFELFEHIFIELRSRISQINEEIFFHVILSHLLRHHRCFQTSISSINQLRSSAQDLVATYKTLNGHLAMSNLPDTETDHHRTLVVTLLKGLLPTDYKLSGSALYLIRELIARNCVLNAIDLISEPRWINHQVVHLLTDRVDAMLVTSSQENSEQAMTSSSEQVEAMTSPPEHVETMTSSSEQVEAMTSSSEQVEVMTSSSEQVEAMTSSPPIDSAIYSKSCEDFKQEVLEDEISKSESHPALSDVTDNLTDFRFEQIYIPEVVTASEAHDSSKKFTLYKIIYKIQMPDSSSSQHQVCRRFREFLNLQERLIAKSFDLKKILREIRGPSRMFPMPIGNMEKDYIEKRRIFLQVYLRRLSCIPLVRCQPEFSEFLAFKSDPRIAFVNKSSEMIPRFDKIIRNIVRDFVHSKIHSNDDEDPNPGGDAERLDRRGGPEVVKKLKKIMLGTSQSTRSDHFTLGARDFVESSSHLPYKSWIDPKKLLKSRMSDSRVDSEVVKTSWKLSKVDSISAHLCRALHDVWKLKKGHQLFIFFLSSRFLDSYVISKIKMLLQPKQWVKYLQSLHTSLWPDGKWASSNAPHPQSNQQSSSESLQLLQQTLEDFFPDALKWIVGDEEYKNGIKQLIDSFQDPIINRHLIYHLLDSLLDLIFPDLPDFIHNRNNINI